MYRGDFEGLITLEPFGSLPVGSFWKEMDEDDQTSGPLLTSFLYATRVAFGISEGRREGGTGVVYTLLEANEATGTDRYFLALMSFKWVGSEG